MQPSSCVSTSTISVSASSASTVAAPVITTAIAVTASSLPFPKLGVTLRYLKSFIATYGGEAAFLGLTTTQVCETIIKPVTAAAQVSMCEYLLTSSPQDALV